MPSSRVGSCRGGVEGECSCILPEIDDVNILALGRTFIPLSWLARVLPVNIVNCVIRCKLREHLMGFDIQHGMLTKLT